MAKSSLHLFVQVLAYGQTGSGKTFTMGTDYQSGTDVTGIIPRVMNDICERRTKLDGAADVPQSVHQQVEHSPAVTPSSVLI